MCGYLSSAAVLALMNAGGLAVIYVKRLLGFYA
jgi:hypothetical protein